jgi:hypothetical protein
VKKSRLRSDPRLRLLIFATLLLAAMLFLSVGLRQVSLAPGQPLPLFGEQSTEEVIGVATPGDDPFLLILRIIFYIGLILVPLLLIYLIFNPETRKKILKDLIRLAIMLLAFALLANYIQQMRKQIEGQPSGGMPVAPQMTPSLQETVHFTGNASNWVVIVASLILAVLITLLVAGVIWFFLLRRNRQIDEPLERIAEEAQVAVDAIEAGGDLRNIIMRCYAEMSRVLSEKRGLNREQFMTPHEFEAILAGKGVPREPVEQLTHVFEEVRYGNRMPGKKEELKAVDGLMAIVEACKMSA